MRVALYYPWIHTRGGAERLIFELVRHSRHRWTVFTNCFESDKTFPELGDVRPVALAPVSARRSLHTVALAAGRIATQRLPLEGHDALVVVSEGVGDLAVFRNRLRPTVCVCLTPLRIAYDEIYRRQFLRHAGTLRKWPVLAGASLFRLLDRRAWERYDHVFCISEEVKRRILEGGLADENGVETLYPASGFVPDEPGDRFEEFFLLPGRIMWTKNVQLGIEAFLRFKRSSPAFEPFRLVIAGTVLEKTRSYYRHLQALADGDPSIEFVLSPSDEELARLYSTCYAVLFTALNEDWGIIPLEAMAFGKPVVCANGGGPRESVVDGVHGLLEEPTPESFARGMATLAADPQLARSMGRAGPPQAKSFSWARFADTLDDTLERLGGHSP